MAHRKVGEVMTADAEVVSDIFAGYLRTSPRLLKVSVTDGVVTLGGEVEKKSMIPLAVRMTQPADGVVDVVAGSPSRSTTPTGQPFPA
jgi:osmotically-inducible protein OsmY